MRLFGAIVNSLVKNGGNFAGGFVGVPIAGDIVVDAWDNWQNEADERERKAELESDARRRIDEAVAEAVAAVQRQAPQLLPSQSEAIVQYLSQVPAAIRRGLRRPADETGTTVPAALALRSASDLLAFLPPKLPRFKPGDQPMPQGDLELVELLGQGGFGEVWKARHLDRPKQPPVALKFCLDPGAARSLERERDLLDHVSSAGKHEGIVQLLYAHLRANPPCLEYEFLEGGDLAGVFAELHANGMPSPKLVAKLILKLARIVAFAHGQSPAIVHRDLKPANVLVRRREGKLSFKIADFGIGGLAANEAIHKLNTGQTKAADRQHDTMLGAYTPLYASPEQMRGDPADPRDDVHALGIISFQAQTGQLTLMTLPSDWRDNLSDAKMPAALLDLLARCIGKQARRPADAGDLANRLASALAAATGTAATGPGATALPGSYSVKQAGVQMRLITPGQFLMGSPADEPGRFPNETLHRVVLTKPYYLAAYPVTRGQFRRFVEAKKYLTEAERAHGAYGWTGKEWKQNVQFNWRNPGFKQDDDHPVVCVSHNDAVAYCEWLSRLTGETYGLPTEAHWEYAYRGRSRSSGGVEITTDPYYFGKAITPKLANFADSKIGGTTKVVAYLPNGFGLYDIHGNVWE
jgi:formylglycine-generating enzyme required for sulfatase activity